MNDVIIDNINQKVKPDDTLYHLGDFCFGSANYARNLRERINCKNIINIWGNHDGRLIKEYTKGDRSLFCDARDYFALNYNDRLFVMCHYPMISWNRQSYGSIMLHGHTHQHEPKNTVNGNVVKNCINVGVDAWDYKPVSIDDIIEYCDA